MSDDNTYELLQIIAELRALRAAIDDLAMVTAEPGFEPAAEQEEREAWQRIVRRVRRRRAAQELGIDPDDRREPL